MINSRTETGELQLPHLLNTITIRELLCPTTIYLSIYQPRTTSSLGLFGKISKTTQRPMRCPKRTSLEKAWAVLMRTAKICSTTVMVGVTKSWVRITQTGRVASWVARVVGEFILSLRAPTARAFQDQICWVRMASTPRYTPAQTAVKVLCQKVLTEHTRG